MPRTASCALRSEANGAAAVPLPAESDPPVAETHTSEVVADSTKWLNKRAAITAISAVHVSLTAATPPRPGEVPRTNCSWETTTRGAEICRVKAPLRCCNRAIIQIYGQKMLMVRIKPIIGGTVRNLPKIGPCRRSTASGTALQANLGWPGLRGEQRLKGRFGGFVRIMVAILLAVTTFSPPLVAGTVPFVADPPSMVLPAGTTELELALTTDMTEAGNTCGWAVLGADNGTIARGNFTNKGDKLIATIAPLNPDPSTLNQVRCSCHATPDSQLDLVYRGKVCLTAATSLLEGD